LAPSHGARGSRFGAGGGLRMKPGLRLYGGGPVGRNPREMTQDELREAGHEPMSPLEALRKRCLDCCGQQAKEVALCPAVGCPSWVFRMGTDPWRKPASEARREAARRTMVKLNVERRKRNGGPSASPPDHGTAASPAPGSGVAPTWATAREDRTPETGLHREKKDGRWGRGELGSALPASGT
jgi:hypothetical protein